MIKLLDLIFPKIHDPFTGELHEGLTQTIEVNKATDTITRQFSNLPKFNISNKGDTIIIGFEPGYTDTHIQNYIGNYPDQNISKILILLNNLGYAPSVIEYQTVFGRELYRKKYTPSALRELMKEEEPLYLVLVFEAKYDTKIDPPELIYHITNSDFLDNIKKIGLKPKSLNKRAAHTERIYFSVDMASSNFLWDNLKYNIPKGKGVLLTIITKGLSNNFYNDPNFNKKGIYTYENIPSQNIIKYKQIVEK